MRGSLAPGALTRLALAGSLVLALAGVARSADRYSELDHALPDPAPFLDIRYRIIPGRLERDAADTFGYVAVRVRNMSAEPRTVDLSLKSWEMPVSRFHNHRAIRVEPGEERFVPLLSPAALSLGMHLVVELDGAVVGRPAAYDQTPWGGRGGRPVLTVLAVCSSAGRANAWARAIAKVTAALAGPRGTDFEWTAIEPQELPETWRALTGNEVVLVDGSSAGLNADRQQLLASYVAGGGSVLLTRTETLTKAPLQVLWSSGPRHLDGAARQAIASGAPLVTGRYGFGRWAVVRGGPTEFARQTARFGNGPPEAAEWLSEQNRPWRDRFPPVLFETLTVPGVGALPVRGFTALIILYVLLVGPVSFFFFKRRDGRPTRAVVLAPLVGLGLTVAILGYGFLGEGTAIRQAVYSLTLLDQTQHTATTLASRTFYAGFAPSGGVAPAAETHLARHDRLDRRQQQDLETTRGLHLLGDSLPSRMPTGFTSVSHGRARPRLRFRRVGPELELLADDALQPTKGSAVVVRTPDGETYLRRANDRLSPAGPEEVRLAVHEILTMRDAETGLIIRAAQVWPSLCGAPPTQGVDAPLPRGTYLLRVQAPLALDNLGFSSREVFGQHIVFGTLGKEDLLDR